MYSNKKNRFNWTRTTNYILVKWTLDINVFGTYYLAGADLHIEFRCLSAYWPQQRICTLNTESSTKSFMGALVKYWCWRFYGTKLPEIESCSKQALFKKPNLVFFVVLFTCHFFTQCYLFFFADFYFTFLKFYFFTLSNSL